MTSIYKKYSTDICHRFFHWKHGLLSLCSASRMRMRVLAANQADSKAYSLLIPTEFSCSDLQVIEQDFSACFMSVAIHIDSASHDQISIHSSSEPEVSASVFATEEDSGKFEVLKNFFSDLVLIVHGCFSEVIRTISRIVPVRTADDVFFTGRDLCVSIQLFRL